MITTTGTMTGIGAGIGIDGIGMDAGTGTEIVTEIDVKTEIVTRARIEPAHNCLGLCFASLSPLVR